MSHDKFLGSKVREHLTKVGIETPTAIWQGMSDIEDEFKKSLIAGNISNIMKVLGLDLRDDSLEDTPNRVAKMYIDEVYRGLN